MYPLLRSGLAAPLGLVSLVILFGFALLAFAIRIESVADSFDAARAGLEPDSHLLLPQLSETAFQEYRRRRAFHAWSAAERGCDGKQLIIQIQH
jgi:hypothetical protein